MGRCRVWESHSDLSGRNVSKPELTYPAYVVKPSDPEPVRAVTVNKPECSVDDTNELLRKLVEMLTPGANPTVKAPEPSVLDKLVQLLTEKVAARKPVLPVPKEPTKLETRLQIFLKKDGCLIRNSDNDRYNVTGRK